MAHTELYTEIRERTRTNNESSCVRGEDGPYPLSHKLIQGGGSANTTPYELMEIIKERHAPKTYDAPISMFWPNTEGRLPPKSWFPSNLKVHIGTRWFDLTISGFFEYLAHTRKGRHLQATRVATRGKLYNMIESKAVQYTYHFVK